MKNLRRTLVTGLLGLALLMTGCGREPERVDGSSVEAFRASLDAVKADLSAEAGADFEAALAAAERAAMRDSFPGTVTAERGFRSMLDGKTGEEVLALGEELRRKAEREEKALEMLSESSDLLRKGDLPAALAKAEAALEVAPDYRLAQAQVEQFREFAADQAASESR